MSSKLILITTAAALTVAATTLSGAGSPASAGQGLTQALTSEVVLELPVSGGGFHFCAFGTCVDHEGGSLVSERLAVALTYDLAKASALPDVASTSGKLSIPDPADPDHRCDGKQGVRLAVSGTETGATSVSGSAKGNGAEKTLEHPADAPKAPTGTVTLCIDIPDITD
jgi:hypothetical protein